ncbi:MAG: 3-oxoacyl-[acyl-carrier protein] reductase, partial [Kribbellaceae bacterium]|nr:3-oxoacyl-[acyl-carrier protein] reductase [Kribbellaceae bacterium]
MDLQLAGLRALVTGGTKGIGRAIVEVLADEGVAVAFCARTDADVTTTVERLRDQGAKVTGRAVDVGDGEALTRWVGDSATELGGLDIVVSNVSALAIGEGEEFWQQSFAVDMMGT